jgi:hypothetical protein
MEFRSLAVLLTFLVTLLILENAPLSLDQIIQTLAQLENKIYSSDGLTLCKN